MSLRYSIYKVQTSFSFQAHLSPSVNCYILAHLVELVKNFFQVFRSFLVVPLCSRLSLFITQLFKFITSRSICQEPFSIFFKSFRCGAARFFARNLIIIPRLLSFVKNFFHIPANSASFWHYFTALADSLHILARPSPFVKHFLTKFELFFCWFLPVDKCHFHCGHFLISAG